MFSIKSFLHCQLHRGSPQCHHRLCEAVSRSVATGRVRAAMTGNDQMLAKSAKDSESQQPCDIEAHLSREGKARNLSSLSKFIFSFSGIPGMVSLHGGLPNASIFPFKAMKVQLEDGTSLSKTEKTTRRKVSHTPYTLHTILHCAPLQNFASPANQDSQYSLCTVISQPIKKASGIGFALHKQNCQQCLLPNAAIL